MFNLLRYKFWKHATLYKEGKYNAKDYYIHNGSYGLSCQTYNTKQSDFEQRCKRISKTEISAPTLLMSTTSVMCSYICTLPQSQPKLRIIK
jgi:hypothetical protein